MSMKKKNVLVEECPERGPSPIRYSAAFMLRLRHGMTQKQVAELANITQADVCEMEKYKPYGRLAKYIRLAGVYQVTVEALVKNDLRAIPVGVMDLPELEYTPVPNGQLALLGRQGEELALRMEQERLDRTWPSLRDLVFPYFKTRYLSPGFDILSLDDRGRPYAIEVKTTLGDDESFNLTPNELDAARALTADQIPYVIRLITNWGTEKQSIRDIPFTELEGEFKLVPQNYRVMPRKENSGVLSGLTYYRQARELTQAQLAEMVGVNPHELSLYENGLRQASVEFYVKASAALDATIDQLIESYEQQAN